MHSPPTTGRNAPASSAPIILGLVGADDWLHAIGPVLVDIHLVNDEPH
ncbi:hypothetical protein [Nocardia abscessus]|nr:hypothetical protein [Nocardia abscessus]